MTGHNLSVIPLPTPAGSGLRRKIHMLFWVVSNLPILMREVRHADAVHTPIPSDIGTIGMLLAFLMRKPLFVRHCGNWFVQRTVAERFWKWFMERFAGGKNVMLATGGASQPPSRSNPAIRWIFATTLGNEELRTCGSYRELPALRRSKLIIVCRQDHEKGTGVVIESLPLILKKFPAISLDVVGDGKALEDFRKLAESLGLSDRVFFHGKADRTGVVRLLKKADLFCYPTRASEGFPKVVLEALACGLPVVTTRVSVLPELIGAGGGQLLDEATPAAVAEAVFDVLSNEERYRRMSEQAIETARQYSLERWRNTIAEHLRSAWSEFGTQRIGIGSRVDHKGLKVCFLAGTLGRGGAERQLVYMLRALKGTGIETRVLCLTEGEPLEDEIRAMGIQVIWVGASRWRPVRLYRIVQELRRDPPHIVQSTHFYTNLYAAAAARLLGIRAIGAIRNDLTSELQCNGLAGWAHLHLPEHLITNSKLARQRAIDQRIKFRQIDVVSNVVDVIGDRPQLNGNGNGKGAIRILFAARLTEQKRPDRLLQTLQKISQCRPDLNFTATIAGDGPLRPRLEQLAFRLGLGQDHVQFLGELKDVTPFYYKSDFLMLTSDWEGTPNVLLEAMACGLPIVATRVGGVPEIMGADRGLIVEPGDEEGLTTATIRMIDDRDLRTSLGYRGQDYVARFHSVDVMQSQLIDVYKKLLFS